MNAQQDQQFGRYLKRLAATLVGAVTVVAAFNWYVDPYRLFHTGPRPAAVSTKARPASNIGDIKRLNAVSYAPTALILGNSRADIGFDPKHPAWAERDERAYNLAVPGQNIPDVRYSFGLLVDRAEIRTVVLAVDFQDFVQNAGKVRPDEVGETTNDLERTRLLEEARSLFTWTGTIDSLRTLRSARLSYPESMEANGFNPLLDYVAIVDREGYKSLFQQRLSETTTNYVRARKGLFPEGENDSEEFAALRDILRLASERQIRLYVVTYPYYGQYYLLFSQLGLWAEFERWKRLMLKEIHRANANGRSPAIEFWDFAIVSPKTSLPLLDSHPNDASAWFWEGGHFKKELGDLLLEQLLRPAVQVEPDERLGARLVDANIDQWLAEQQIALQALAQQDPAMTRAVRAALDSAVQAHRP